jgi:ABC-type transporter Mla subunit MlaD
MAKVVVAIGLAAAIAGLLDVSARLNSKLDDIRSTSEAFGQTIFQLTGQLQLLTTALSHIQKQAKLSEAFTDNVIAVLRVIQDTSAQGESLNRALEKFSSQEIASVTQRLFRTMASSKLENRCQQAMRKMRSNIEILTLYQQTILFDNVEVIRNLLSRISWIPQYSHPNLDLSKLHCHFET